MFLCLFLQNKRHMPGYFNDEKPALVVVFTARGLLHLPVLAFYLRGIHECTVVSSTDSLKNMKPENAPTFGKKKAAVAAVMSKVDMQIIQGKELMSAEETGLMSYIYINVYIWI